MQQSFRAERRLEELYKELEKLEEELKELEKLNIEPINDYRVNKIQRLKEAIVEVVRNLI